ncbi:probable phosphatase 2C 76 [Olea europaea subsp. europaea]|uniref:Probable phosphatase 2C 76 n=1 Tax=Olea europaea subsp. europaea TaxID=158383 RepID=A0A8S0UKS4_OLEEU|nr:probable phosphatase 2C 76 [Olea europaea subsp. europaea]
MARGRVDIDEFVKEEAVATLEVVSQARLVARVFKPKEEEEGSNKVFALLTSDSEFPHKNPSGNHNFMLTSSLAKIGLNMQEARGFFTINGRSLDVCVVYGWPHTVKDINKLTVTLLEPAKDTLRDDDSTASLAVLVGNHPYVANVGDSRTIISKVQEFGKSQVFSLLGSLVVLKMFGAMSYKCSVRLR